MRLRIDTKAKTVAIEETVTFDELHKMLKSLFPEDYKQWKVDTNVKFEITSSPIVVSETRPYWQNPFYYGVVYNTAEASSAYHNSLTGGDGYFTTNISPQMLDSSNAVQFLDIQHP